MIDDGLKAAIQRRGVKHLVHFTKSSNLPYILGEDNSCSGIMSTGMLNQSDKQSEESNYRFQLDLNRYDNKDNCVCCSIENINYKLFYARNKNRDKDELFNDWATLFIDPAVINNDTYFSTTNAASKATHINNGVDAFEALFRQQIANSKKILYRNEALEDNEPTDVQAEVLIKGMIHKSEIVAIAFPRATYELEKARLRLYAPHNDLPLYRMEDTCYQQIMLDKYNNSHYSTNTNSGQTYFDF